MNLLGTIAFFAGAGRRRSAGALGCLLLITAASPAAAQEIESPDAVQQILVLQSLQRGNLTLDHITNNFRVDVEERVGRPLNIEQVAVGRSGLVGASDQRNVDYIRSMYAGRPAPDLIVSIAGPAAVFARKYRKQLFPEVPLVLAAADVRFLGDAPLGENETAVSVINDFPRLIDDILGLLPETRQVFMVTGSGTIGQFWNEQLAKDFKRFEGRLTFIESSDLALPGILRRSATLPGHSAILYLAMGSDAQGGSYPDERVLADLHATANAPMFAGQSAMFGYGIVGGSMMNLDDLSRKIVDVSIQVLNGESPGRIKVPPQTPGAPIFDWREMQRWRIPESRLPANSVVVYRAPSLWQEYRVTVLTALGVMAIQFFLISGLLYQRRERQRAEFESRKNLALAADASRRATMSALTSSIAHELGQPLGSMIQNAHALQLMVTANRASPDTIDEVLSEIRAQGLHATQIIDRQRNMLRSHQLDKKATDLHDVIRESLALVAPDMRAREVEPAVILSPDPVVVSGDQVLLQQVLVNLMMNAMDAMSDTPPDHRILMVRTTVRGADVDVSVRDRGTGLPDDLDGKLFTPFVTTKSHGLGIGLTIVETIIAAHGGVINARNNPDGGATFTVTLRRSETPQAVGAA